MTVYNWISGGQYVYYGLKKGIEQTLSHHEGHEGALELSFNIDGMPVYKSRHTSVWPIQGSITNILPPIKPFIIVAGPCIYIYNIPHTFMKTGQ